MRYRLRGLGLADRLGTGRHQGDLVAHEEGDQIAHSAEQEAQHQASRPAEDGISCPHEQHHNQRQQHRRLEVIYEPRHHHCLVVSDCHDSVG